MAALHLSACLFLQVGFVLPARFFSPVPGSILVQIEKKTILEKKEKKMMMNEKEMMMNEKEKEKKKKMMMMMMAMEITMVKLKTMVTMTY